MKVCTMHQLDAKRVVHSTWIISLPSCTALGYCRNWWIILDWRNIKYNSRIWCAESDIKYIRFDTPGASNVCKSCFWNDVAEPEPRIVHWGVGCLRVPVRSKKQVRFCRSKVNDSDFFCVWGGFFRHQMRLKNSGTRYLSNMAYS